MSSKTKAGAATAPAGILGELCRACLGLAFTAEEAEELRVGVEHHHTATAVEDVTVGRQTSPEGVEVGVLLERLCVDLGRLGIALAAQQFGITVGRGHDLDSLTVGIGLDLLGLFRAIVVSPGQQPLGDLQVPLLGTRFRRRLLDPLRLHGTVPSHRPEVPGLVNGYAGPENPFGAFDATMPDGQRLAFNPQFEWGGGGFASTALDLSRWTRAVHAGDVIPEELNADFRIGPAAPLGPARPSPRA